MTDIPEWAIKRARAAFVAEEDILPEITPLQWRNAFARYIAEHEEAPVDPLVAVAQGMAFNHVVWSCRHDYEHAETLALAAIKHGMELAMELAKAGTP